MTSLRHRTRIRFLHADGHRLTRRERVKRGLPPEPVRRPRPEPRFPADPGAYAWFVLMTAPQQEAAVTARLTRGGFVAFNPIEWVMVKANRRGRHKREKRERAMLTSYVLFAHPLRQGRSRDDRLVRSAAGVPWRTILETEGVTGVVGFNGCPLTVPLAGVLAIRAAHEREAMTRKWSPVPGGEAMICDGPFAEKCGTVVELREGSALVRLFGKGVLARLVDPVKVPEAWLTMPEGRNALRTGGA